MDTAKCRAFIKAVQIGSFNGAAEALGYTAPALRHQIVSLEEELGVKLFYRKHNGIALTSDGHSFLPLAREFVAQEERMLDFGAETRNVLRGSVRIGAYPSVAAYLLPPVLAKFRELHPGVNLEVFEEYRSTTLLGLERDGLDLAFITSGQPLDFQWTPLMEDELVAAVPANHPLAKKRAVPLAALSEESFIMPGLYNDDNDAGLFLESRNIHPQVVFTALSNGLALGLVREGLGISLVYRLSAKGRDEGVALLPLDSPQSVGVGIASREDRPLSPAATAFRMLAEEMLGA